MSQREQPGVCKHKKQVVVLNHGNSAVSVESSSVVSVVHSPFSSSHSYSVERSSVTSAPSSSLSCYSSSGYNILADLVDL